MHRRGRRWWCASAHHPYLSVTCIAPVRGFLVERYVVHRHVMCLVIRAHLDTRFFPVRGVGRYVVHRHVMCVVIRAYLDTRFFPVGVDEGGGVLRHTE